MIYWNYTDNLVTTRRPHSKFPGNGLWMWLSFISLYSLFRHKSPLSHTKRRIGQLGFGYGTLQKVTSLAAPQFPHLQKWSGSCSCCIGLLWVLNKRMHFMGLAHLECQLFIARLIAALPVDDMKAFQQPAPGEVKGVDSGHLWLWLQREGAGPTFKATLYPQGMQHGGLALVHGEWDQTNDMI